MSVSCRMGTILPFVRQRSRCAVIFPSFFFRVPPTSSTAKMMFAASSMCTATSITSHRFQSTQSDSTKAGDLGKGNLDFRIVKLHNMPRTWMHEDVIQFLHHVAEHAGIESPSSSSSSPDETETGVDADSAVPHMTSPFVASMHIPFGRRTGIVFGAPIIRLTSPALADYLVRQLSFDPDDYRCRIHFTDVTGEAGVSPMLGGGVEIEDALESEQQEALETLELDRYLMAPDLLYDMAKMRQRRLVTRRSRLLLHNFAEDDSGEDNESTEAAERGVVRRVGDCKDLGRGSMQNIPLPVPYVRGRRGV